MSRYLTATLLVLLTACGGLPDVSVSLAEAIHKRVEQTRQEVDAQEQAYQQFQASDQYSSLARYAEKESWARRFTDARKILDSAETLYQKTVAPILERDDEKELQVLNETLKKISPLTASARGMSLAWKERSDFITPEPRARACADPWRECGPAKAEGSKSGCRQDRGPDRPRVPGSQRRHRQAAPAPDGTSEPIGDGTRSNPGVSQQKSGPMMPTTP